MKHTNFVMKPNYPFFGEDVINIIIGNYIDQFYFFNINEHVGIEMMNLRLINKYSNTKIIYNIVDQFIADKECILREKKELFFNHSNYYSKLYRNNYCNVWGNYNYNRESVVNVKFIDFLTSLNDDTNFILAFEYLINKNTEKNMENIMIGLCADYRLQKKIVKKIKNETILKYVALNIKYLRKYYKKLDIDTNVFEIDDVNDRYDVCAYIPNLDIDQISNARYSVYGGSLYEYDEWQEICKKTQEKVNINKFIKIKRSIIEKNKNDLIQNAKMYGKNKYCTYFENKKKYIDDDDNYNDDGISNYRSDDYNIIFRRFDISDWFDYRGIDDFNGAYDGIYEKYEDNEDEDNEDEDNEDEEKNIQITQSQNIIPKKITFNPEASVFVPKSKRTSVFYNIQ